MNRKSFCFTADQLVRTLDVLECIAEAANNAVPVLGVMTLVMDMQHHTEFLNEGQAKISLSDVAIKVLTACIQQYHDCIIDDEEFSVDDKNDAKLMLVALNNAA